MPQDILQIWLKAIRNKKIPDAKASGVFYVCYTFLERKKQTHKAITKALSAGIASFVYGHFQPLSTQRKIVLVTKTVVAKIQPPTRE